MENVLKKRSAGTTNVECRERRSHSLGVYATQDTSRIRTASVKQEKEADKE